MNTQLLLETINTSPFYYDALSIIENIADGRFWQFDRKENSDNNVLIDIENNQHDYEFFTNQIKVKLQKLLNKYEDKNHPITLEIDAHGIKSFGRIILVNERAFLELNIKNILGYNIDFNLDDINTGEILRIAKVFAHEFTHYQQYLNNWNYFVNRNVTNKKFDPVKYHSKPLEIQNWAIDTARELIDSYGGTTDRTPQQAAKSAFNVLKYHPDRAVLSSDSLRKFMHYKDKYAPGVYKKFIQHLFKQLIMLSEINDT